MDVIEFLEELNRHHLNDNLSDNCKKMLCNLHKKLYIIIKDYVTFEILDFKSGRKYSIQNKQIIIEYNIGIEESILKNAQWYKFYIPSFKANNLILDLSIYKKLRIINIFYINIVLGRI